MSEKKKEIEALISVVPTKPPNIKYKVLKDTQGNEIHIVRSLIDGIVAWGGPALGKSRADVVSIDPAMGGKHKSMVLGITLIPPGNELAVHSHDVEEGYMVVKGRGVMYTDAGEECEVKWGDAIWNGPGVRHCLRNHGDEDLWIVWCWAAPEVPSGIEELRLGSELAEKIGGEYAKQFQFKLLTPP